MDHRRELWHLEEQFWLGDSAFYECALAAEALMVFPPPVGVLDREATIRALGSAPRWQHVSLSDCHTIVNRSTAVLVYAAQADRGETDSTYAARCSSTYIRDGDRWRLALHHQTPAGPSADGS